MPGPRAILPALLAFLIFALPDLQTRSQADDVAAPFVTRPWTIPQLAEDPAAFQTWQQQSRAQLCDMLGIPGTRVPLNADSRGELDLDDIVIEKWVYTSEPGSRIPALVYRPRDIKALAPGLVLTYGHGDCKSHPGCQYVGQLYAKLGFVVLSADPLGEEERHISGKLGTRAHDPERVHRQAWDAGRPIMGKLVWDTMRGIDFMLSRKDVDPKRIGIAGNSLGGAKASWVAPLEPRISFAVVSGWAFHDYLAAVSGKFCTRTPNAEMRKRFLWQEFMALSAPQCRIIVTNGDADTMILGEDAGEHRKFVSQISEVYEKLGVADGIRDWYEAQGGHRPYQGNPEVVEHVLGLVNVSIPEVVTGQHVNFGEWCDRQGVQLEKLYGTQHHYRGATMVGGDIRYFSPKALAVLTLDELGTDDFTIEGWLKRISEPKDQK